MSQPLGSCVIVFNSQQQILLGKRQNGYKPGSYGLPGGHIEVGENVDATARRELLEEVGLSNKKVKYVGVIKENQGAYDFVHFVFTAHIGRQTPQNCEPHKCEGWEWFNVDKLPKNMLPGHRAAIQLYQHKLPIAST